MPQDPCQASRREGAISRAQRPGPRALPERQSAREDAAPSPRTVRRGHRRAPAAARGPPIDRLVLGLLVDRGDGRGGVDGGRNDQLRLPEVAFEAVLDVPVDRHVDEVIRGIHRDGLLEVQLQLLAGDHSRVFVAVAERNRHVPGGRQPNLAVVSGGNVQVADGRVDAGIQVHQVHVEVFLAQYDPFGVRLGFALLGGRDGNLRDGHEGRFEVTGHVRIGGNRVRGGRAGGVGHLDVHRAVLYGAGVTADHRHQSEGDDRGQKNG